jgi:hypothetical protein
MLARQFGVGIAPNEKRHKKAPPNLSAAQQ